MKFSLWFRKGVLQDTGMSGRGKVSRSNRRPYFYHNRRKRQKLTVPKVIPQSAILESAPATSASTSDSLFTAPISFGDERIQAIPIVTLYYPGWQLYFPTESFKESSPLVGKIKAFEKHIINHPFDYFLQQIRKQQWFYISANLLIQDSEFQSSWINFNQQLYETTNLVLSCLGLAMHSVVTTMSIKNAGSLENNSGSDQFNSRKIRIRKINARPVDFYATTISNFDNITPESYDRMFVVQGRVDCIEARETNCTWVSYRCKRCGYEQSIRQGKYPTKPLRCRIQCNSRRNFKELRSSPYTKVECIQVIHLRQAELQCGLDSSHRIDIELREDLVDLVCLGSEITVTGVLKIKSLDEARNQKLQKGPEHNAYIQAVSIVKNTNLANISRHEQTHKDLEVVQMITREPNCLRLLVQSLAPEMCGHEMVKAALLLSLFGGSGSQMHDEGELHVLVVGDPGVGKSNLVQNAASIAEKGKLVSGKNTTDFVANILQMRLLTGLNTCNFIDIESILLSGHCCIDDMDKLSSNQETLIHIMQTKSLAARSTSAGFNVALRTSVIAAVNTTSGHYDSSKLIRENVRLSPSLLSLFHLVFVLFDKADKDRDNMLAEHVKALHSGMKKVLSIPVKYSMELKPNDDIPTNGEYELDERLKVNCDEQLDLLPTILLKKYIAYARQTTKPLLTKEAAEEIKDFYLGLRSEKNDEKHFPITTRLLEGLIRLTQARARIDLCSEATKEHARDVIQLVRLSYTDTSVVDRLNSTMNRRVAVTSHGSQVKKFIQMLQLRSNAMGRKVFEFEELKDMASQAGIRCDVTSLVELVNMHGYLLKKGPNLYEVRTQ